MGITKICKKCKIKKDLIEFNKNIRYNDGLQNECKDCTRIRSKIYYKNYIKHIKQYKEKAKEKIKNYQKEYRLRKYELTLEKYNEMLKNQNNVCKICKNDNKNGKRLAVGHCHKTNKVRGLLCETCNRAIGLLKDDVQVLQNAIQYIKGDKNG